MKMNFASELRVHSSAKLRIQEKSEVLWLVHLPKGLRLSGDGLAHFDVRILHDLW